MVQKIINNFGSVSCAGAIKNITEVGILDATIRKLLVVRMTIRLPNVQTLVRPACPRQRNLTPTSVLVTLKDLRIKTLVGKHQSTHHKSKEKLGRTSFQRLESANFVYNVEYMYAWLRNWILGYYTVSPS